MGSIDPMVVFAQKGATWENLEVLIERFPNFGLEDKDNLESDGNDANEGRGLKNAYNRAR